MNKNIKIICNAPDLNISGLASSLMALQLQTPTDALANAILETYEQIAQNAILGVK